MKTRVNLILKSALLLISVILVMMLAACNTACQHTFGEWTEKTAPTCETEGAKIRTCTKCNETEEDKIPTISHEFKNYTSNGDATCIKDATETAKCTYCDKTDTRTVENSKNPAVHASTETRYQESATIADKHDKIYVCCNAIIETTDHRWDEGVTDSVDPSVTRYTCQDCDKTKTVTTPAHTHSATRVAPTEPGCTEFGNIEYWYCASCDTCFADEALTTEITEQDTLVSPTHVGGTATCTSQAVCTRCDTPYGPLDAENHTSTEFTFVPNEADAAKHDKKYACCGALVETLDHRNDEGRIDGTVMVYVCYDCEKETHVPIEGHVHSATYTPAKTPSCTESGNVEYWYCEGCEKYFSDEELTNEVSYESITLAPKHTSTEFTYTVNSTDPTKHDVKYACCGTLLETVTHTYEVDFSYAASCEEKGYNLVSCVCGAEDTQYTAPARGHSVNEWTLDSESAKPGAECTYVQTWIGTCFICRTELEREAEVVRHTYKSTITLSPTCTTAGEKTYVCDCGAAPTPATEVIEIDPNAHAWDDGVTVSGITTYTCQNTGCGAEKTAIVSDSTTETLDTESLVSNEVILGDVSLDLDDALIGNLDSSVSVTLTANPVLGADRDALISALPESLRTQINEATPILDFALTQNGVDVDFDGGKIRITMKYNLPSGTDADCITVWYVNSQNELSFYEASYYEVGEGAEKQGYIWFDAEHFSTYLPGIAPSTEACDVYTHLWETTLVAPTCTSRGYTEYHCQRCGESKIDDVLYSLGHAYEITDMTPSTCQTFGSRTQVCTREGCGHEETLTLPLAAHSFEYDSEKSQQVTCTQDGIYVYSCTRPGCDATKENERIEAWGHSNYREVSARLVTPGTKCTDGVIITYQCGNENYETNTRCPHTIEKTVYEHIDEYQFENNKDDSYNRKAEKIMLGSYLTAAGISYQEEPYVEIREGCICGAQHSSIALFDGTNQNGEQLFWAYGDSIYSSDQAPYPGNNLYNSEYTANYYGYDPALGQPIEASWTIRFCQELTNDGCVYTYSVLIGFGYNSQTGTYADTMRVELSDYEVHKNTTRTVTLDDPTKSCYYNCNLGTDFVYGIHVTDTCNDCGKVTYKTDTSVSSSSAHYYYTDEVYEDENGFKVHIRTCPCGATRCDNGTWSTSSNNYAGVASVERGNYSFTSRSENFDGGNVTIYTGTYNGDTFIYAVEYLRNLDKDNCRDYYPVILYLDCDAENYKTCDREVVCDTGYMTLHTYETETVDTVIAGNNCYVKRVTTNTCVGNCGKVIVSESVIENHTPITTTKTDANGTKTVTSFCEECGYYEIKITNANGQLLSKYTETATVYEGEVCFGIFVELYEVVDGEIVPTLERSEIYEDMTKQTCISWSESSYQYLTSSDSDKGCFKLTVTTISNSKGYYSAYESEIPCCEFGEIEYREATCQQEGYERRTCTKCGYVEYLMSPHFGEHDIWSTEPEYQERTCIQDGYERRHCANCDYFEETYRDYSYGHSWETCYDLQDANGNFLYYNRCNSCGVCTGSNPMYGSSVGVMPYSGSGDAITIKYVNNENPDNVGIDAEYEVVVFRNDYDDWGSPVIKTNEDGTPYTESLNITVTDNDGVLSILYSDIERASAELGDFMNICLAVTTTAGDVVYIILK